MEKTIEIKAIDKEKALKRALNILGVELTENEAVEIIEKVKPRKKFFGLFGTDPGLYEVSIKTKIHTPKAEKMEKSSKYEKQEKFEKIEKVDVSHKNNSENNTIELKDLNEKFSTSRVSLLIRKGILKKEFEEVKFEEYNFWDEELEEEEKRAKENEEKSGKKTEIVLNKEQQEVYDKFKSIIDEEVFSEELLYGVTGSRKDRDIFKNNQRCT